MRYLLASNMRHVRRVTSPMLAPCYSMLLTYSTYRRASGPDVPPVKGRG